MDIKLPKRIPLGAPDSMQDAARVPKAPAPSAIADKVLGKELYYAL
jgi:hypothetical protein